jgi:acetyl-CoA acetyltransferase
VTVTARAAIAAVHELPPGRYADVSVVELYRRAVGGLLDEWGVAPGRIDGVLAAPADEGTEGAYGAQSLLFMHEAVYEEFGIEPRFADTMYAGGATYGLMVQRAATAIAAGRAEAVLCVGAGKFPRVSAGGGDAMAKMVSHPEFEYIYGAYVPVIYALAATRHMAVHGSTSEQLAAVAAAARAWALEHPDAVMRDKGPITVEDVLHSRPIASPFRLLDCSRPCEGGAALLVTSEDVARQLGSPPCVVLGMGEHHSHGHISQARSLDRTGAAESADQAFRMAGLEPGDVGVVEIYDAFTINPILCLEDLGFCPKGEAGRLVLEGRTDPGGDLPMNTNGGLLSFGHTGRSSGLSMIVEGALQVMRRARGRQVDADVALVHSYGGMMAEHSTLILGSA